MTGWGWPLLAAEVAAWWTGTAVLLAAAHTTSSGAVREQSRSA